MAFPILIALYKRDEAAWHLLKAASALASSSSTVTFLSIITSCFFRVDIKINVKVSQTIFCPGRQR